MNHIPNHTNGKRRSIDDNVYFMLQRPKFVVRTETEKFKTMAK